MDKLYRNQGDNRQTVSLPDLYGSKLCAAVDRQHPRDLFDVKVLLQSKGIDRDIFVGFLAYLLSHNRPISGAMNPGGRILAIPSTKGSTV